MKDRLIKTGLNIGLGTSMGISLTLGIMYLLKFEINYLHVIFIMGIVQMLCIVVFSNKKASLNFVIICTISIGVLYVILQTRWAYIIHKLLVTLHEARWEILLISSMGVFVYLLTYRYFKRSILIGVGGIIYSILLIKDVRFYNFELGFFILISLLYCFYAYFLELIKQEEGSKAMKLSYFKSISFMCALTLSFTAIGSYVAPIQFKALHKLLDKKRVYEQDFLYSRYYPYTGMLGGDIVLGDEEVLEVMATENTYLRADSKAIYKGSYWTNTIEEPIPIDLKNYQLEDTIEMVKGMSLLTEEDDKKLYKEQAFRITFKNLITKSLFIPNKSNNLVVGQYIQDIYKKNDDTIVLNKAYGKDFTYIMQAYIPEYNTEEFKIALNKSKKGLYKEKAMSGKSRVGELSLGELEKLSLRSERIYETFTQLPEALPERVKDLAYEITKDYSSDYDKARALESYLAGNYSYTLSPGEPTRGQDFVDEFLFDNKKGYCTYFATAMAVLSRCIGLPSRYVEGYSMSGAYKYGNDISLITSKQAHAWTEIYFEGFGWMIFEPTASYQSSFRRSQVGVEDSYYKPARVEPNEVLEVNSPAVVQVESKNIYQVFKSIMFVVGIGTLGILLIIIYYRKNQLKKMKPRLFVLRCYEISRSKLAQKGLKLEKGETELSFARRVDERLNSKGKDKVNFVGMTKLYLLAWYSENEIEEEHKKEMDTLYTSLGKKLKSFRNKKAY
nr:transglutaminase-like domain-containing protein [uncultured Niameybacter sp.]